MGKLIWGVPVPGAFVFVYEGNGEERYGHFPLLAELSLRWNWVGQDTKAVNGDHICWSVGNIGRGSHLNMTTLFLTRGSSRPPRTPVTRKHPR